MSRIIETEVFKFPELSDAAKEKAREWYRNGAWDYDWWDSVYADADTIAGLMGITMDRKGKHSPTIYFSGFWSQGDGACFEGTYCYKKGSVKAIKDYAPRDEELHRIATGLQDLQRRNFYALSASMKQHGHYNHSGCMTVSVSDDRHTYRWVDASAEDELTQYMRDFADWIYGQLEKEYEWLTSDEQVDEAIIANEYEFDAEGNFQ